MTSKMKIFLLCKIFDESIEDTLDRLRKSKLSRVYEDFSYIWTEFKSGEDWSIELHKSGDPIIMKEDNILDFSQLSGGEKTAFLHMLRIIMCRYFAKSDFLLLDEPFEHLDEQNRHAMMSFIKSAYNKKIVNQVILTSFEEEVIRKYIGLSYVTPIFLTSKTL